MACQWQDEQTGGHCPELVRHFTGTTQKWFTFTNGAHIDSLDPDTFNRWYDFLQLFVAHQAPIAERGDHPRRRAGHLPAGDGPPADRRGHAARRPDPAACRRTTWRSPRSTRCRRCGCCSTTAPARARSGPRAPATPTPGSRRTSRRSPSPAPPPAPGTSGRAARSPTRRRRAAGINSFTADAHALPAHRLRDQHRHRRVVGQRVAVVVELAAEPGGHRGLVRLGAAHREHHGRRQRRGRRSGCVVDARRRPAGHDQRGAARRERDRSCRTAGSAPASASSRPTRTTCSSGRARRSSRSRRSPRPTRRRCRPDSSSRSSSRSTTRATRTAPGRASG